MIKEAQLDVFTNNIISNLKKIEIDIHETTQIQEQDKYKQEIDTHF